MSLQNLVYEGLQRGRARNIPMPVEYDLIRMLQNITSPDPLYNTSLSSCEWEFASCDEERNVVSVDLENHRLEGEINWKHAPTTIEGFYIGRNLLRGSIALAIMPPQLEVLNARDNCLTGTIQFSEAPRSIKHILLDHNLLSGEIRLRGLPQTFEVLDVSHNTLTGALDFYNFPSTLRVLRLNDNLFTGSVELDFFPDQIEEVYLHNNPNLEGDWFWLKIPMSIKDWKWENTKIVEF